MIIPSLLSRAAVPAHMGIPKLTALGTSSDKAVEKLPAWKPWKGFCNLFRFRFTTMQLKTTGIQASLNFPLKTCRTVHYIYVTVAPVVFISLFRASCQSSAVRATLCNSTDFSHTLPVCEHRWRSHFCAYFHKKAYCSLTSFRGWQLLPICGQCSQVDCGWARKASKISHVQAWKC